MLQGAALELRGSSAGLRGSAPYLHLVEPEGPTLARGQKPLH